MTFRIDFQSSNHALERGPHRILQRQTEAQLNPTSNSFAGQVVLNTATA